MTTQLTFGLMSGVEKTKPYAVGDILVKADGRRYVVTQIEQDAYDRSVFLCIRQDNGATAVLLEKEIAWRSS